jgi:hypothetical protein
MDHDLTISNNGIIIQIVLLLLSHDRVRAFDQGIQITTYMNQIGKIELFFLWPSCNDVQYPIYRNQAPNNNQVNFSKS